VTTEPTTSAGRRRPKPEDLAELLDLVETMSLRKACAKMGLDRPSTTTWIGSDPDRSHHYERAREERGESLQEEGLDITKAAALGLMVNGKKVDPAGARVYLDAIKWAKGQMAPKTTAAMKIDVAITDLPPDAA
jgi:hypothetical protein